MNEVCVITGAGSGVGRAVARLLAARGWRLALVGRREEALRETVHEAGVAPGRFLTLACDVGDPEAVDGASRRVLTEWGRVEALVNSAGTNAPRRALEELSLGDYHAMIATNLHGAFYWTQALLPQMRTHGGGTIVNVVSDAGKLASPKAGPGYVMSKFGLAGLTQSINAEERSRGIRACAVFPGDIDTPLLEKRPAPPGAAARARMLRPEDVAQCVVLCLEMPPHAIVEEILVRPR